MRDAVTTTNADAKFTRRPWRILAALLIALTGSYWAGRQLGLSNDDLLGYVLASVSLVIGSGLVALLLFGLVRLFRRSR
jgi:hypothetical protein